MLGAYINFLAYFVVGLPLGVYLAFDQDWRVEDLWLGLTIGIAVGCALSLVLVARVLELLVVVHFAERLVRRTLRRVTT